MVFSVLQIVAPVFVIIAAGYAALRLGYLEAAALVGLSAFVLRVALPALVFNALAGAPVGETMDARYLAGYCAGSLAVFAAAISGRGGTGGMRASARCRGSACRSATAGRWAFRSGRW